MKVLKCDQCGTDKNVSSYTVIKNSPLVLEYPKPYWFNTCGDGISIFKTEEVPTKELCEECISIINKSYKHFLEEEIP